MNGVESYKHLYDFSNKRQYRVYIDLDDCLRVSYKTLSGDFNTLEWLLSVDHDDLFEADSFDEAEDYFNSELLKAEAE